MKFPMKFLSLEKLGEIRRSFREQPAIRDEEIKLHYLSEHSIVTKMRVRKSLCVKKDGLYIVKGGAGYDLANFSAVTLANIHTQRFPPLYQARFFRYFRKTVWRKDKLLHARSNIISIGKKFIKVTVVVENEKGELKASGEFWYSNRDSVQH